MFRVETEGPPDKRVQVNTCRVLYRGWCIAIFRETNLGEKSFQDAMMEYVKTHGHLAEWTYRWTVFDQPNWSDDMLEQLHEA